MKSIFSKDEINEILQNYNLGNFVSFNKIKKNDSVSFGQVVKTTKGLFFMKVMRKFDKILEQSLKICHELRKLNFPTYQIYPTNNNKFFLEFKENKIVFYEFIPNLNGNWKILNKGQMKEFGRVLAEFHNLTKTIEIPYKKHDANYINIKNLIEKYYDQKDRFSKRIQEILNFTKLEINNLNLPKNQFLTGYFSEFNPVHAQFKGNKIFCVLDWAIGNEEAFYDIGSSMVLAFNKDNKSVNFDKLNAFIEGYSSERKLTQWEKEHLFDAFKFGVLKYGIWGFVDLQTGDLTLNDKGIDKEELDKLIYLKKIKKNNFNKMLCS